MTISSIAVDAKASSSINSSSEFSEKVTNFNLMHLKKANFEIFLKRDGIQILSIDVSANA